MEGISRQHLIPLSSISESTRFGFRYDYRDPVLETSLEKRGVIFPLLVVERNGKRTVVSGHKRFFFLRRRGANEIPSLKVGEGEPFSEKELFLLSVYSNWNQNFAELDRMKALHKAEEEFDFSRSELQQDILPALSLPPHSHLLDEYRNVAGLSSLLHQLIFEQRLPFRGAAALGRFSLEEQVTLAEGVFSKMHLTTNQLSHVAEWLLDLKRSRHTDLRDLLSEPQLVKLLEHPRMDDRSRGSRFFETVRLLRFPKISAAEGNLKRLKDQWRGLKEIQVDRPEGLDSEGVLLRARLKDRESVGRVLRFLESHREALESFL